MAGDETISSYIQRWGLFAAPWRWICDFGSVLFVLNVRSSWRAFQNAQDCENWLIRTEDIPRIRWELLHLGLLGNFGRMVKVSFRCRFSCHVNTIIEKLTGSLF